MASKGWSNWAGDGVSARSLSQRTTNSSPTVVLINGREEPYTEAHSQFFIRVQGQWKPGGATYAEALTSQAELEGRRDYEKKTGQALPDDGKKTPLAKAAALYLANCESVGKDKKTLRAYRGAVDSFVGHCKKAYVEDVERQDVIDWIGWMRKQPVPQRRHGNHDRTLFNRTSH